MNISIAAAGKTDIGLVRKGNEDCFKIIGDQNLFIVCDGMGGHLAGEVASKEATSVIGYCFTNISHDIYSDNILKLPAEFPEKGDLLVKAIRIANRSIYTKSLSNNEYSGMGTTVVAAVLQDDLINIAHVGDSRVYRMTDNQLVQLTTDHSWVSELQQSGSFSETEAAQFTNRNVITRALGVRETVEIDFRADKVHTGEIYIFCSDGLCAYAEDDEILAVAKECNDDINLIVDNLVQLANDHGGQDNVTVIAVRIENVDGDSGLPEIAPVTIPIEEDAAIKKESEIVQTLKTFWKESYKTGEDSKIGGSQIGSLQTDAIKTKTASRKQTNKSGNLPLILIFIAFIAIVIIIYLLIAK